MANEFLQDKDLFFIKLLEKNPKLYLKITNTLRLIKKQKN